MNNRKNTSEKYAVSASKRFAIGAASVLTATALVGVGAQGAFASTPDDNSSSGSASTTATAGPQGATASGSAQLSLNGLQRDLQSGLLSGHVNGAKAQAFAKKIVGDTAVFSLLPSSLQNDLTTLKDASATDRTADAKKVVSSALSGGYGTTLQDLVTQLRSDHARSSLTSIVDQTLGELLGGQDLGAQGAKIAATVTGDAQLAASLPASLRTDLGQLANAPAAEQTGDVQKIETTALGGGYGSSIQNLADQIQSQLTSVK